MIVLLEPPRTPGFVSGGYRYQENVAARLAARGDGELRVVAPSALAATVAGLRARGDVAVVDGLFAALGAEPLPAGAIVLLHMVPDRAGWFAEPPHVIATAGTTAAAVRGTAKSVAVVRPGLDPCFRPGGRSRRPGPLRVVCVGTICPDKGQHLAASALADADAGVELVLVGDERSHADYVRQVRAAARRVPLRLTGNAAAEAVARELQAADLFVSASRRESFGMAAAEAAACGVPVFAFAAGEIATFVEPGQNGWLVPLTADDAAFAARLAAVVKAMPAVPAPCAEVRPPALHDWGTVAA